VGQWELDRTCAAIVKAEKDAHLPELITFENLQELLDVVVNSDNWDRAHPCAHARPPTEHSHTFWAGGT
jgi:hypothetical protein